MDRFDKILGAMYGVACGDALGGTLEFMRKDEITDEYGYLNEIIGGGWLGLLPGEVTDDTYMTLAVAKGVIENPDKPIESIGKFFLEWFSNKPKDIGRTCELSIRSYLKYKNWKLASKTTHDYLEKKSAGNGTLMRCIPVPLYYNDYDKIVDITIKQSEMTHFDNIASNACVLYNTLVYEYLNDIHKMDAIYKVLEKFHEYNNVLQISIDNLKSTGFVVDTLECALWCFINTSNFEDAVCTAANLGGDADTVAAITGGLAGVYYGYNNIPKKFTDKILIKEDLNIISKKIFKRK